MTKAIPQGYHAITPYITCKDVAKCIEFYTKALGAEEVMRLPHPKGNGIMHAEIRIGDSPVMLGEECAQMENKSAESLNGSPVSFFVYCDNVDEAFARAKKAGMQERKPLEDMFWGDRMGALVDPFGHQWSLAQHVRDVSPQEIQDAVKKMAA